MRRHDDLRLSRRKLLAFGALSTGFALAACSNGEYAATASPTRTGAATTAAAASGTRRPASGTAKVAGPGATPAAQLTTGPTEKVILTYYQFGGATDPQTLILPHATQVFNQKLAPRLPPRISTSRR